LESDLKSKSSEIEKLSAELTKKTSELNQLGEMETVMKSLEKDAADEVTMSLNFFFVTENPGASTKELFCVHK
jgi:hypothetical protein